MATQSSRELEERDGFASLTRIRIAPHPLQRVPSDLIAMCFHEYICAILVVL